MNLIILTNVNNPNLRIYPNATNKSLSRGWDSDSRLVYPAPFLEPAVGFEPTTYCLRNSCSASELHWHKRCGLSRTTLRARGLPGRRLSYLGNFKISSNISLSPKMQCFYFNAHFLKGIGHSLTHLWIQVSWKVKIAGLVMWRRKNLTIFLLE